MRLKSSANKKQASRIIFQKDIFSKSSIATLENTNIPINNHEIYKGGIILW